MTQRIEVRSQAEFDACVKAGNIAIVIGCFVEARGNSSVEARENSSVVARENSSVEAWENSSVVAWGNSSVVARENSSVEAWENSSVEAWGNVFVRFFSALKIRASKHVAVMIHGNPAVVEGGQQIQAMRPEIGADWCEYFGIDPAKCEFAVPNIDAVMFKTIEENKKSGRNGLDMGSWHGTECDETNWCNTPHCRAGYAICLAGKAGFELERKYGPETAGKMIYAVSAPTLPLPDFHATNDAAMADIKARAGVSK
jgi:hypothetical protein